jgi:hypothetical protein
MVTSIERPYTGKTLYRNRGLSITGGNTQPRVLYSEKGEKEALEPNLSTHLLVVTCKLSKQKRKVKKKTKLKRKRKYRRN